MARRVGGSDSRGNQHGHGDGNRCLGRARDAGGGVRRGQRGRRRRLGRLGRRRRGGRRERDRRAAPGALAPRAHMCAKRRRKEKEHWPLNLFMPRGRAACLRSAFRCAAALAVHATGLSMAGESAPAAPAKGGRAARRVPRGPGGRRDRSRSGAGQHGRLRRSGADRQHVGRRRRGRRRGRGSQRRPPPGRRSLPLMKWRGGWVQGLAAVQMGVPPGCRCQSSEREPAAKPAWQGPACGAKGLGPKCRTSRWMTSVTPK